MNKIIEESAWALKNALERKFIDEDDSAIIFQSWDFLELYLKHLQQAFNHQNALHAIAIKTNPHPAVLQKIVSLGFGLEAASIEEVKMAIKAGIDYHKIVFDSPVKTRAEISFCQSLNGMRLNVNCLEELDRIPENSNFLLGIRINPIIETGSPEIYSVSKNESKFGVPISDKEALFNAILKFPVVQLHVHSGSHMNDLDAAVSAIKLLVDLAMESNRMLERNGIQRRISTLDIGGGLAPEKLSENKSRMQEYVDKLKLTCPELWDFELITEFGQWVYFYTAYAFSRVEYVLNRNENSIAYLHLGADYMLRDVYVKPRKISFQVLDKDGNPKNSEKTKLYDIAGPLCFAGDYLEKQIKLTEIEEQDWLGLIGTGSNSYGLWSRHCSRTIPKFIGVSKKLNSIHIISERYNPFV